MALTKKEKEILETFEKVLPYMTEREKDKILYIGEGIALKTDQLKKDKDKEVV